MQVHDRSALLRREADEMLYARGLLALAEGIGETFVGGSYFYDMMTWRDLDLYVKAPNVSIDDFFAFGADVTQRFGASKAFFTDNRTHEPPGLYWGIRLGDLRQGAWKFDIWAVGGAQFENAVAQAHTFVRRLTPEIREVILRIKEAYWNDPRYRDTITSAGIYEAVLDHGIRSVAEYAEYFSAR